MDVKVTSLLCGLFLLVLLLDTCITGVEGACKNDANCLSGLCYANGNCGCKAGTCGVFCQNSLSYCKRKASYVSNCRNGIWMYAKKKCVCFGDYGVGYGGRCNAKGRSLCDPPCAGEAVCYPAGPKRHRCVCRKPDGVPETGCVEGSEDVKCPAPSQPEFGSYTPIATEYGSQQTIVYNCDYGFTLTPQENKKRQCTGYGVWDVPAPTCDKVTCPYREGPDGGGLYGLADEYVVGDTVQYFCQVDYTLKGPASSTCMEDGSWDSEEPVCNQRCYVDVPTINGGHDPDKEYYDVGEVVTFYCDGSYNLVDSPKLECKESGSWDEFQPSCEAVKCPAPDQPEFGSYTPIATEYGSQQTIVYNCDYGFKLTPQENDIRQCTGSGVWDVPAPTCVQVRCPYREGPVDGGLYNIADEYVVGDTVQYFCQVDYTLKGPDSSTCMEDGSWDSEEPVCNQRCYVDVPMINGGHNPNKEYYDVGEVVTFYCDGSYTLVGSSKLECKESGVWDEFEPSCESSEIYCDDPPGIPHGSYAEYDVYVYPDVVVYECEGGHYLEGEDTLQCQKDGTWSPEEPSACKAFCLVPDLLFGSVTPLEESYRSGAVITYSCEEGFQLYGGTDTNVCTDSGSWQSVEQRICVKLCSTAQITSSGGFSSVKEYFTPGETAVLQCELSYYILGPGTFKCMDNGEWDETEYPVCEMEEVCGPPSVDSGGVVNEKPRYSHGEYIKYYCDDDYHNSGDRVARCMDGSWSGFADCLPSVKTCSRPVIPNGGVDPDQTWYNARTTIEFHCIKGYKLTGNLRTRCSRRGSWGSIPDCREQIKVGSCSGRCGKSNYRTNNCQCNYACKWFGGCCDDYDDECLGYELTDV